MTNPFSSHVSITAINHYDRTVAIVLGRAPGSTITASNISLSGSGEQLEFKCSIAVETVRGTEEQKTEMLDWLQRRENNDAFLKYIRSIAQESGVLNDDTQDRVSASGTNEDVPVLRRETTWSWA